MLHRETGRPRGELAFTYVVMVFAWVGTPCLMNDSLPGFGFVTFESELSVDRLCAEHFVKLGDKQVFAIFCSLPSRLLPGRNQAR